MTMRRYCEACERAIFFAVRRRDKVDGLTMCARCHRQQKDQLIAERIGPKPWFRVRSTLRVLEEQSHALSVAAGEILHVAQE